MLVLCYPTPSPVHLREAKLSVLEWDPSSHALRTSSMHYFEGEPSMRREARAAAPLPPRVVADPAGRCAAMAMAGCHVALLPVHEVRTAGDRGGHA